MVEGDKHDNASSSASIREGNVPLQCPKLTYMNYRTWALMMETILKACGLWNVIDGIKETGGKQNTAIDEKAENTAKGMIFQTLPQDIIQAKFKSLGGTLKDKVLVRKLLNSVPKKFLPIVASIEQYQEIDTMQFEEAVGRITAFEEGLKSQDKPEDNYQNKLLLANSSNQGGGRGHGRNFTKNKSSNGEGLMYNPDSNEPLDWIVILESIVLLGRISKPNCRYSHTTRIWISRPRSPSNYLPKIRIARTKISPSTENKF
ncbi:zinc finger, CCHC-type [Artemisia annua]|uniref:Zinc finger, CCHC-type n=1 Tax=Artemisia annua TaxID=35608 RepID=A0A2U1MMM3_ARTAN|nr:zinc finger, CCHC-type [Artemisia annua]